MKKNLDMEILKILEDDARISLKDMAVMLDVDAKTIEKRIKELRSAGVIRKFKTSINWKKAGRRPAVALIQVKVVPQERSGFARTCREIAKDSRVKDVAVATGEYDLVIRVEAEDIEELSKFVTEKLAPKKEVVGTYTQIVLEEYKRDGVLSFEDKVERLKVTP
ncbi:MAG: Lrp/AsnC family transcriptional regulator [Candidatus Altiarchaeota archaeon]|nr:Lrp/AsnC family transcriptional regulator [Candidatus Altiarchaeota archaeon]